MTMQLVASKQAQATLKDLLIKAKPSIAAVLPKHLNPDRLIKIALVATSRSPALLACAPSSVLQAVMTAAQLGLDAGGVLGSAYLVPYKDKDTGQVNCQLIIGYRGLVDLARRSGQILTIEAHVVYEKDGFDVCYGLEPKLSHAPCLKDDPGKPVAAYAVAHLRDGGRQAEVMTKAQIDAIRERSRAGQKGPWVTDYDEMARKTVVKRLCKYLPLSPELAAAIEVDNRGETGEVSGFSEIIDVAPEEHEEVVEAPPAPVAALKEKVSKRAKQEQPEPELIEREPGSDG